jgi:hypothetical protein
MSLSLSLSPWPAAGFRFGFSPDQKKSLGFSLKKQKHSALSLFAAPPATARDQPHHQQQAHDQQGDDGLDFDVLCV